MVYWHVGSSAWDGCVWRLSILLYHSLEDNEEIVHCNALCDLSADAVSSLEYVHPPSY